MLAELADMEKAMIHRQSSSRAALDETRKRLDKIKVKANKLSTRDRSTDNLSEKLPYLTPKDNVNNP